jgi:hypothetical protein
MDNMTTLLGSAVLAVTVLLGIVWQLRARARRRLNAALDAHANREIAQARNSTVFTDFPA